MKMFAGLICFLVLAPAAAGGQTFFLQGAGGLNVLDTGHNLSYGHDPGPHLSLGAGVSPWRRVSFLIDVERTHRASQLQTDARGNVFGFRGGTATLAVPQVRFNVFDPDRVGPYGIVGVAAGVSRLNVTEEFPERVSNDVRALALGGGLHVPLRERISLFVDGRILVGSEANEIFALAPIRAGLAWRF
jgi:hypothetical protein